MNTTTAQTTILRYLLTATCCLSSLLLAACDTNIVSTATPSATTSTSAVATTHTRDTKAQALITPDEHYLEKNITIHKIIDGDTVIATKKDSPKHMTIRLIGIDTPELKTKEKYAELARIVLDNNIEMFDYTAHLEYDPSQDEFDKYGRTLGYLWVENPDTGELINLNLEQLKQGLAREYTYEKDYRYKKAFLNAQNTARGRNLHIWEQ